MYFLQDMKSFINRIRNVEIALGQFNRSLSELQKESRKSIRRSPYLKVSAKAGTSINNLKVVFRKPGYGISPKRWEELLKRNFVLKKDLFEDQCLKNEDFINQ